jgi:hypothetical protein
MPKRARRYPRKGIEVMATYTKAESAAINAAWQAIREVCTRTNWSDGPQWRDAEKLERKQVSGAGGPVAVAARAMICKAWAEGLDEPEKPLSKIYWIRPGYRDALLLGVRHAIERRGDDYTGPIVETARQLCEAAIAANEAHTRRIVEG